METALQLTRQACTETPGAIGFLKLYHKPFMYSSHPMIIAIGTRCEELGVGHSGSSFALCMRRVQDEVNKESGVYKLKDDTSSSSGSD